MKLPRAIALALSLACIPGCALPTMDSTLGFDTVPAPFTNYTAVLDAIDSASTITLSAYTLAPSYTIGATTRPNPIITHLAARAAAGAHVSVVLTGDGFDYALEQNHDVSEILTRAGARVRLTSYPLHMKALVTDGRTIIVSDENFSKSGLYETLPPAMGATVERAILGTAGYYGPFTTAKATSLNVEAALLEEPHAHALYIETESFGANNSVFDAINSTLASGHDVVLLANAKDARESRGTIPAIQSIADAYPKHFRAYLVRATEKIAINGDHCWTGSSNSSPGLPEQIDFGLRIDEPAACAYLLQRLRNNERA